MKQSGIFVLDKCEITVNKKLYSEPHVDLHNLRKSKTKIKSVEACEQFCSILKCWFSQSQSLLYCQFCHMYRTYIQRIEIALLSYSLVHTDNTKH